LYREDQSCFTRWQYDSWNRIRTILYPEGERWNTIMTMAGS